MDQARRDCQAHRLPEVMEAGNLWSKRCRLWSALDGRYSGFKIPLSVEKIAGANHGCKGCGKMPRREVKHLGTSVHMCRKEERGRPAFSRGLKKTSVILELNSEKH